MLLLAGGDTDPQIVRLLKAAATCLIPLHCLLTGQSGVPRLRWDIRQNLFFDGNRALKPGAAFLRQDVFAYLQSNKQQDQALAREWYVAIAGWLLSNPDVRVFNRKFLSHGSVNKPYVLRLALQTGLEIADTYITNDKLLMDELALSQQWVKKPVSGGAHCENLAPSGTNSAMLTMGYPQIVQHKLAQPELRIFRIGSRWLAFHVISDVLDYRTSSATRIELAEVPEALRAKMEVLADELGLDFAAADFKTDIESGNLQFLEINTNPMFAGFDQIADGQLCRAMLQYLLPEHDFPG